MAGFTLKMIRDSFEQKREWEKQFPVNYYLVRPFSFYLTYIVLKITENPAKVALFGFIIGIIGCIFLAFSSMISIWPGICFILLYSISDAVDGNVARTTKNVTLFGKYLDGIIGSLIDGNYFLFLGIGLYFSHGCGIPGLSPEQAGALALFLGSFVLVNKLWSDIFRSRHRIYRADKEGASGIDKSGIYAPVKKSVFSEQWYFILFTNIECLNNQLFLLIILSVLHLEIWFLVIFAGFFLVRSSAFGIYYFIKTREMLR